MMRVGNSLLAVLLALVMAGCSVEIQETASSEAVYLDNIPAFSGEPYVVIGDNRPDFEESEFTVNSFESYSPLDDLGRCHTAYACVGVDLMPTEDRGSIGSVKPSGWQTAKYDCVEGKYLYNRCHLIGFQLTGENANKSNLITGTRYMNVDGMLPFENMVADYVKETEQHVLYRVTPFYSGENLVADGVRMEALSVEDRGESICFDVYVYNCQPGVVIDYATGESWLEGETGPASQEITYILNTSSKKFHLPDCSGAASISEGNREEFTGGRSELVKRGYEPCGKCKP
ncbi:MAG: DNA/RNA non-specific endonuclease [Oscillospiraceae bacterium]|jgi:DNA-entry nuclease|nr:DNA/RNA non-specific endonuclease [Oscillospiraceae bacterium]